MMAFRAFPEYTGQLEHYKSEGRHVVRPPDVSDQHYQQLARCERNVVMRFYRPDKVRWPALGRWAATARRCAP
jgi:hypothetical protein